MAQEIVRICDPCMIETGTRVDAAVVVLDTGRGPLAVDLCEQHLAELVKPLADAVALWGVKPDPVPAKARTATRTARKTPAARPARPAPEVVVPSDGSADEAELAPSAVGSKYVCTFCQHTGWDSRSAWAKHLALEHGVAGFASLAGTACPVCGAVHGLRGSDSLERHVGRAHGLASVSWAVLAARAIGDPFGVDARVRAAEVA